jgi:hypothetical protein
MRALWHRWEWIHVRNTGGRHARCWGKHRHRGSQPKIECQGCTRESGWRCACRWEPEWKWCCIYSGRQCKWHAWSGGGHMYARKSGRWRACRWGREWERCPVWSGGGLIRAGGQCFGFGVLIRSLAIGLKIGPLFALRDADALGGQPVLLGKTFSFPQGFDAHLDGRLRPCLLVGCNDVLFW